MNDDDDKTDAQEGAGPQHSGAEERWNRSPASSRSRQDQYPARNTAPAGTPMQKAQATLPLGTPLTPDQLGPPPIVTSTSERPPAVETVTPTRTVGGHTARLKVPERDEEVPRTKGRRPPAAARARPPEDEDDTNARPPPSARGAGRDGRAAAMRAKEGAASWEAEGKPEGTAAKRAPAPAAPAAAEAGQPAESRWPIAIALGAVAFAIGSLLPLPFRKLIVGNTGESTAAQLPVIPLPARSVSAAPSTAAPAGASASAASAAPSSAPGEPASAAPAASSATAAPSGAASTEKRPGAKGAKGGHIGDIF